MHHRICLRAQLINQHGDCLQTKVEPLHAKLQPNSFLGWYTYKGTPASALALALVSKIHAFSFGVSLDYGYLIGSPGEITIPIISP